jgi:uncharacterized protein YndB with AHSA1/START domain
MIVKQDSVSAQATVAAPVARVWQALHDAQEMGRWLLPPALNATLTHEGTTLKVGMGPMQVPFAHVEVVEPGRALRLLGLPDGQVRVHLEAVGAGEDQARVELRAEGFAALDALDDEDRAAPTLATAPRLLANLAAYVEGRDLPWPEGYVAALFGYRRESPSIAGVERSVWLPAPVEQVWPAVSTPAGIEGWFSPGTPWHLTALAEGGRLFVRDATSGAELYTQIIQRVEPPHLLVLRAPSNAEGDLDGSTYLLRAENNGTRLSLANYGYERVPVESRAATLEQTAFGFGMVMENLHAYVMGRPLPYPGGF